MSIGTQIDLMANGLKETAMNEGKVMNIRWPLLYIDNKTRQQHKTRN